MAPVRQEGRVDPRSLRKDLLVAGYRLLRRVVVQGGLLLLAAFVPALLVLQHLILELVNFIQVRRLYIAQLPAMARAWLLLQLGVSGAAKPLWVHIEDRQRLFLC